MAEDFRAAVCHRRLEPDAAAKPYRRLTDAPVTPNQDLAPLLATARELYGRVVYTHKVHEVERELWSAKVCWMSRVNILLAGATTIFAIISASLKPTWALVLTAILSAATICFVVWQSNFDPGGQESQHRIAATETLWICEQLMLLIANCHLANFPLEQLQRSLEMVTRELTAIYKFLPDTSSKAYGIADARLKGGQFTFSDDEIDGFLPADLRKKPPKE